MNKKSIRFASWCNTSVPTSEFVLVTNCWVVLRRQTFKLTFGHRVVINRCRTCGRRCGDHSHNHGFAVVADSFRVRSRSLILISTTVRRGNASSPPASFPCNTIPSCAGPHDAEHHFQRFIQLMEQSATRTPKLIQPVLSIPQS